MSNCALGTPLWSDVTYGYQGVTQTPAFAAFGSWSASLPLTNLQDRRLSLVARSSDATAASTKFRIDLGVARAVGCLALVGHNLSAAATVQWKGGTSAGASDVYNPGALALSFAAVSSEDRYGINFPAILIPAASQTARYWECDIVDTANTDGYVQIGRLIISGLYTPTINMSYGAKLGLETETVRTVSDGGAAIFQAKAVRRNVSFVLDNISESEAFASPWKIQRLLGTSNQVMWIFDKSDTTYLHERSFLGVLKELTALDFPYALYNSMPFQIVEEL